MDERIDLARLGAWSWSFRRGLLLLGLLGAILGAATSPFRTPVFRSNTQILLLSPAQRSGPDPEYAISMATYLEMARAPDLLTRSLSGVAEAFDQQGRVLAPLGLDAWSQPGTRVLNLSGQAPRAELARDLTQRGAEQFLLRIGSLQAGEIQAQTQLLELELQTLQEQWQSIWLERQKQILQIGPERLQQLRTLDGRSVKGKEESAWMGPAQEPEGLTAAQAETLLSEWGAAYQTLLGQEHHLASLEQAAADLNLRRARLGPELRRELGGAIQLDEPLMPHRDENLAAWKVAVLSGFSAVAMGWLLLLAWALATGEHLTGISWEELAAPETEPTSDPTGRTESPDSQSEESP